LSESISDHDHGCPRRLQSGGRAAMDSLDPVVDRVAGGYLAAHRYRSWNPMSIVVQHDSIEALSGQHTAMR